MLVTGAAEGVGEAIARAFGREGAKVLLAAGSRERLEALAAEIGGGALPLAVDLGDPEACRAAVAEAVKLHGAPDVLVSCSGATADQPILAMDPGEWDRILATNLTALFAVTQEAAKGMARRRSGRIINVMGGEDPEGRPGDAWDAGSKAGIVGFTKNLARQIGSHGVTVNAIAPGRIESANAPKPDAEQGKKIADEIVLRRLGRPEEIASACLFLASEDASYVTGEVLNVSGGLSM